MCLTKTGEVIIPHGLNEYSSLELEINLPIQQDLARHILNEVGLKIANNEIELRDGKVIEGIVNVKLGIVEIKGACSDVHKGEKKWDIKVSNNYKKS